MAIKAQPLTITLTAIDSATGKRKSGDSANITPYLIKDGTAGARHDATAVSEPDSTNCPGDYKIVLDSTDTNANSITVTGKSATAGIEIIPVKIVTEQGKIATLDGLIKDVPTVAEFNARTILSDGYALDATVSKLTAAQVWDALLTGITAAGSIGRVIKDNLNTAIDTRMAAFTYTAPDNAGITAIKAKTDTLPAQPAAVGSAMAVSDKTGFSLTSAYDNAKSAWSTLTAQQVWEYGTRSLTSLGSAVADMVAGVWAAATRTLTDKTGFSLTSAYNPAKDAASATNLQGVADTMATQLTVNAIKAKTDNLPVDPASDTSVNTRLAAISYSAPDNAGIADIKTATDQLTFTSPGKVDATATASVDEAAIATAIIAGLGGQTITVQSPIISVGVLEIVKGDSYNPDKTNRRIRFVLTGATDLTGATVLMDWTGDGTATCIVTDAGLPEQIVDVPLTAVNTSAMSAGPFKIFATWPSPTVDTETLVIGQIVISGEVL